MTEPAVWNRPWLRPRLSRGWLTLLALTTLLVVVLVITQVISYDPVNPVYLAPYNGPKTEQVPYLWVVGDPGTETSRVVGNSSAARGSTTLLLNDIYSSSPASVTYIIDFPEALDFGSYRMNYTVYVPADLYFAHNSSALTVDVAGRGFSYSPEFPTKVSWFNGTVYGVEASQETVLPDFYRNTTGNQLYLPFSFQASNFPSLVNVTISVPVGAQLYVPNVILIAGANFDQYVASAAIPWAWALMPAVGLLGVAIVYVAWRLRAGAYAGLLGLGVGVRLALAPVFLHSDLQTLSHYPQMFYNFHILGLQAWGYGLGWLATTILPLAPLFAVGAGPTLNSYNVLLKVPGIICDALVFLVLMQVLTPKLGESRARLWASAGWLFNPLVIYFSAVHGLPESALALALVGFVWAVQRANARWALVALVAGPLVLLNTVIAYPIVFLSRFISWSRKVAALAILGATYLVTFALVYGSLDALGPYLTRLVGRGSEQALPLGTTTFSNMTFLLVLYDRFGLFVAPTDGLLVVIVVATAIVLLTRRLLGPSWVVPATYGSLLVFYFTYETFYVQHLVWVVPLIILLLAANGSLDRIGLGLILGASVLGLVVNSWNSLDPLPDPYLAIPLFAFLLVPLVVELRLDLRWPRWAARVPKLLPAAGGLTTLALLGFSAVLHPLSEVNDLLAVVILGAFLTPFLPWGNRSGFRAALCAQAISTTLTLVVPVCLWFDIEAKLPFAIQLAAGTCVAVSMAQLVRVASSLLLTGRPFSVPASVAPV